ncbi:MAG: O-antigen ligase family protein [Pseudomonadota bacterium]
MAWAILALLAFAALSSFWALHPGRTLSKLTQITVVYLMFLGTVVWVNRLTAIEVWQMARGVVHGSLLGMAYLAFELASGRLITTELLNLTGLFSNQQTFTYASDGSILNIPAVSLNRNVTVLSMLFWPVLLGLMCWLKPWPRTRNGAILVAFAIILPILVYSESETAKIAFIAGSICLFLASANFAFAYWSTALAWISVTLFIIPLTLVVVPPDADYIQHLPASAQDRTEIWNYTINETLKSPIIGVGAVMTRYIHNSQIKTEPPPRRFQPRLSHHTHNIYLQTWFELGLVGALLLFFVGTSVLFSSKKLNGYSAKIVLAQFASAAVVGLTSYGMWQVWLITAVFTSAVFSSLAIKNTNSISTRRGRSGR